jgi:hypothetical protein
MTTNPVISFALPDGQLRFGIGDLDPWAEHLTWCFNFLGVRSGATIGVLDFGASPVSFLGSRLLTPGLVSGVAERLPATVICLDGSRERVALVPRILDQVSFDVLVVRDELRTFLLETCRDDGVRLDDFLLISTLGTGLRGWDQPWILGWRRIVVAEATMLLAPECNHCRAFHIRGARYSVDPVERTITALGTQWHQALPDRANLVLNACSLARDEWIVSFSPDAGHP